MEWIQPAIEAGAITVVSVAIAFVAFALYKMSGTIPTLTAAMGKMAENTSDAISDGREERETYQESNRLLVTELRGLTTALIKHTSDMKTGQAAQAGGLATLTTEVSGLRTAMTDERPDLLAELRKITEGIEGINQRLDAYEKQSNQRITAIRSDVTTMQEQVVAVEKRVTDEHPAVAKTAAQRAVDDIVSQIKPDNPAESETK